MSIQPADLVTIVIRSLTDLSDAALVLGSVANDRADYRRVQQLKSLGYNAIRTSHNPVSPGFLDACDRLGMLVGRGYGIGCGLNLTVACAGHGRGL